MFRLLKPVPGKLIEPRTPDLRPLNVTWNGPSLIDLVNDLMPCSVILNPAMVRSKLNAERSWVMFNENQGLQYHQQCN